MSFVGELSRQFDFWRIAENDEEFIDDDDEGEIDHVSTCTDSDAESSSDERTRVVKDESLEDAENEFYLGRDETTIWKKNPIPNVSKSENTIVLSPEVKRAAKSAMTPLDAWKLFFDEQMLKDILRHTNAKIRLKTAYYDADHRYQVGQTTMSELKAIVGLLYFAGVYRSNNQTLEELWNANGTGIDIFRLAMSFSRFTFLISFLSFNDIAKKADVKKTDKITAIRDIFERFVKNCQSSYTPGEYLTIHRRYEKFRGPCPFRQFAPKNREKCGIEIFHLLDTELCYVLNMEIYCGKNGATDLNNGSEDIVDRLVAPISRSERIVAISRSLASYETMIGLLKNHELTSIGRVARDVKEIPDCFTRSTSGEKKSTFCGYREDISVISHVGEDGKRIVMFSTLKRDRNSKDNGKSEAINALDYARKSGELFDELSSTHDVSRNSRRWSVAVFFALLNVAGINSQIIYKLNTNNHETKRRDYLQELARSLVKEHLESRKKNQRVPREIRQKIGKYFGDPVETYRKRRNVHGRCALCPREKDRKSFYGCAECHRYICMEHAVFYCEDCCSACEED